MHVAKYVLLGALIVACGCFFVSSSAMTIYLIRKGAMRFRFLEVINTDEIYIEETRKKYGHIGFWLWLKFGSLGFAILVAIVAIVLGNL